MAAAEELWEIVEPYLAAERLELDDLELVGQGRGRTLRVVVDGDGGVNLDRLAEVSEGLSRLLDAESDLDGPYQLEVTSPGLERKLQRPRHFAKSVGREVVAKVRTGEAVRTLRGTLVAAHDSGFIVETDEGQVSASYDEVVQARTVFRWEAAPKPGKR
jgi:ribosome maturation factor RimP